MKAGKDRKKSIAGGGHGEKYSRKSQEAIAALLSEPSIEAAARKVGISASTLRRWMKEPDFQQRYREEQRNRSSRTRRMRALAPR